MPNGSKGLRGCDEGDRWRSGVILLKSFYVGVGQSLSLSLSRKKIESAKVPRFQLGCFYSLSRSD